TVVESDDTPVELERDDARFVLTVHRHVPGPDVAPSEEPGEQLGADEHELQLALFDEIPAGRPRRGIELPPPGEVPPPAPHDVSRLSYSAIALFERCSYRYYAERVLGLPWRVSSVQSGDGLGGLAATEIGDAVHRLLELVPLDEPAAPARDELDGRVRTWYA